MTDPPREQDSVAQAPARRATVTTVAWCVLAAVPVVVMIVEVLRAPALQFLDYWTIFQRVTEPDGGLRLTGLAELHNEHPAALPGLAFWLNAKLLSGTNQALGIANIAMAAGIVAVLYRMLPGELDRARRLALLAGFSFLVFAPSGMEIFGWGMSGMVLLTALLPGTVSLLFAHRGRTVGAVLFAALACLGHGSAFALWPALAIVAWLRAERWWRVLLPVGLGVAVVAGWLMLPKPGGIPGPGGPGGLDLNLAIVAGTLSPLREGATATALGAGAVVLALLVTFAVLAVRDRLADGARVRDAGWIGLGIAMLGAAAMVGISRADFGPGAGLASRYAAIPAIACCVALTLVVVGWRAGTVTRLRVAVGCLAAVTFAAGTLPAINVRNQYPSQTLMAVAMRVGADDVLRAGRIDPAVLEPARAMGHYPFNDAFTLDCGVELGERVDLDSTRKLGAGDAGYVDTGPVRAGVAITGWTLVDERPADCVLVVDREGTVVGGGYTDIARADVAKQTGPAGQRAGWRAVAGPGADGGTVLASSGGVFYQVKAGTTAPEG